MLNTSAKVIRPLFVLVATLLAMTVAPLRAQASPSLFIDLGTGFGLSSTVKGFEKAGVCSSFSFGTDRDTGGHVTSDFGQALLKEMEITRVLDSASPKIWQRVMTGTVIPTVKITQLDSMGQKILELTLTDVFITNYNVSGSGDDRPYESFTLSYRTITFAATLLDPATGKVKSTASAGWDVQQNTVK
jgi:type VI protein secretion system component Hcp